ncbi:hypothetical protein ENSA5_62560 [Enhygromyxa salina]|uniref:Uncharacterized protein n=1 Tax=Enhygromyxa salina TaxID=215803 RepID=A0A2S9XCU4_9BACT|nr:hypothetical protein [Enhygromyxa salina]PRP90678.1 hypothetical protein ENSA5_62560 [Enhygromyxa salina]
MFGYLANLTQANTAGALIALAVVFVVLVGATLALESEQAQAHLAGFAWYQRFELLRPADLRFRGLVSLGVGLCSFAALLTLKLFVPDVSAWSALALASLSVVAITLGAAFLERAAHLDGYR